MVAVRSRGGCEGVAGGGEVPCEPCRRARRPKGFAGEAGRQPWPQVRLTRHHLYHRYGEIDLDIVTESFGCFGRARCARHRNRL
jgi:hypothetical protein